MTRIINEVRNNSLILHTHCQHVLTTRFRQPVLFRGLVLIAVGADHARNLPLLWLLPLCHPMENRLFQTFLCPEPPDITHHCCQLLSCLIYLIWASSHPTRILPPFPLPNLSTRLSLLHEVVLASLCLLPESWTLEEMGGGVEKRPDSPYLMQRKKWLKKLVAFFSGLTFHFSKGIGHTKVSAEFKHPYEWSDL